MNRLNNITIRQTGFVLPIALILLLVTTLIGVTTLKSSALSEKMTRNTIQRNIAFNNAETALLEGEEIVRNNAIAIKAAIVNSADSDTCSATVAIDTVDASGVVIDTVDESGFCSPANFPQTASAPVSTIERWKINDIWADTGPQNYISTDSGSKIIIEFVGHILDENNQSNCTPLIQVWPYCDDDNFQFRITVLATGDDNNAAQVVLQSTYVVAN